MTTLDDKIEKRSFFSLYKPTQGKYVRWGTVAGAAVIFLTGAYWVWTLFPPATPDPVKAVGVAVWLIVGTLITFLFVNTPKYAEFLIMTESEMRKVTWPTRAQVLNFTKVVVFLTLLLGVILWIVDAGFVKFFEFIGLL